MSELADFNGLDDLGYILNLTGVHLIQDDYQELLGALLDRLKHLFKERLHSVYLYGSVARGEAVPGKSDIDVSLVLRTPETLISMYQLNQVSFQLTKDYPVVSKVDLDPTDLDEVLRDEQRYHWQFWLTHCCCCLWGDDLGQSFPGQKPSLALAFGLNRNFSQRLNFYLKEISSENVSIKSKEVGKLFIRVAYALIAEKDQSWFQQIECCAERVILHCPELQEAIQQSLMFIDNDNHSVDKVLAFVRNESQALKERFERLKSDFNNP